MLTVSGGNDFRDDLHLASLWLYAAVEAGGADADHRTDPVHRSRDGDVSRVGPHGARGK